jgi:hypothetical protein
LVSGHSVENGVRNHVLRDGHRSQRQHGRAHAALPPLEQVEEETGIRKKIPSRKKDMGLRRKT